MFNEILSRLLLWKGNVDSLGKPSYDGWVELPGKIGGSQNCQVGFGVSHSLHLNEELCLNSLRGFILIVGSGRDETVDFIDENDRTFLLSSLLEEILHLLFRLSNIFGHDVTGRDGEENSVGLSGAGLGKESLACSGRTV